MNLSDDREPIINQVDERDSISYEEFGGDHDYTNCPTCQGTGRVPRTQQQELVALIPYDDDRLKPKRTALWVTLGVVTAVIACGGVAALLVFLLVPRTIIIEFNPIQRNNVTFAAPSDTSINVTIPLRVENPNWTGANFTSVDMDISFLTSSVSKSSDKNYQILGARTDNIWHNITAMLSFNNNNHLNWISDYCTKQNGGPKVLALNIQLSTNITFHQTVQQTAIKQLCFLSCDPNAIASSTCNKS